MQRWEGIQEFVAAAETRSFTKAGERLGTSTAQVSRLIAALERRLNIKLLNRTTRKVSLTEAGQVYYQHCKPILEELAHADQLITELHDRPKGKLRITAPVTYGERIMAPMLNNFARIYPDLDIHTHFTNRVVDLVNEGFDLAIRLGQLSDDRIIAHRLGSRTLHTCASPAYLSRFGFPNTIGELKQHQCLLGTSDYWRFSESGQEYSVKLKGRLRYNSGHALIDAALKDLGVIQLPDYYVQSLLDEGRLLPVMKSVRVDDDAIWAVYPETRAVSTKVRLLLDFLTTEWTNSPDTRLFIQRTHLTRNHGV